jgi:hypothetical protein
LRIFMPKKTLFAPCPLISFDVSICIVLDLLVMEMGCCLLDIYPYPFFFILKYLLCHQWGKVPILLIFMPKKALIAPCPLISFDVSI